MRLVYHYSEVPDIAVFQPRPVAVPAIRRHGQEWLNGPLVWAISATFAFLYLFPRDCPRIVIWAKSDSDPADQDHWMGAHSRVAYVQTDWFDRIAETTIYRYVLPADSFTDIDDVGMAVSARDVAPVRVDVLTDLPAQLAAQDVTLRPVDSLQPVEAVWGSTLHASGIRLRNAT